MIKNKSDFIYMITSLLDTLKLEKTVRSFVRLSKLENPSSQTLTPSIKNFSSYRLPSQCEKSREMFLTAPGTDPFKMNQMDKTLKSNLQAQSSSLKQKIFKTMYVRKLYIIENSLNCRMKYSRTPFYAVIKIIHN
jgi:hypothetical protein